MRLLLVSGLNGQTGAVYRTENEQYSRIEITSMLDETPATFTVKTTDGTTYKYGNSTGRLHLNANEAYQWTLDYAATTLHIRMHRRACCIPLLSATDGTSMGTRE